MRAIAVESVNCVMKRARHPSCGGAEASLGDYLLQFFSDESRAIVLFSSIFKQMNRRVIVGVVG